jgi:hypothetical protein
MNRLVHEHHLELERMTESQRRLFSVVLDAFWNVRSSPTLLQHHTFPGMAGVRRGFRFSRSFGPHLDVVPIMVMQPALVLSTIDSLGGEDKLDRLVEEEGKLSPPVEWSSDTEASPPPGSPHTFPSARQVLEAHGDSLLHTVRADIESFSRAWIDMVVSLSNLRAKLPFIQHHNLNVTSATLYPGSDGQGHEPFTMKIKDWVMQQTQMIESLPVPLCVHVDGDVIRQARVIKQANKDGGMLGPAARSQAGLPYLYHASVGRREVLRQLGTRIPSSDGVLPCEGCLSRCSV